MTPEAKAAKAAYEREYKKERREKIRQQQAEWRERNREHYNAYMREYYHKNKEAHKERQARYWERKAEQSGVNEL